MKSLPVFQWFNVLLAFLPACTAVPAFILFIFVPASFVCSNVVLVKKKKTIKDFSAKHPTHDVIVHPFFVVSNIFQLNFDIKLDKIHFL